jgi:hypothetical protein
MQYLCSYKGTHSGWQGLVNIGIRTLDARTIYSHSEAAIGNPFQSAVPCVSASGVDGGVRRKVMRLSPARWDILPMPWVTEENVTDWEVEHRGKGYDHAGVGRFVLPFLLREHPDLWFCSETVMDIAGYPDAFRFTPATAHVTVFARLKVEYPDIFKEHMQVFGFGQDIALCRSKK